MGSEMCIRDRNTIDQYRNPDFLLEDGELLSYFKNLELLFYEETILAIDGKQKATARFVGRKRC